MGIQATVGKIIRAAKGDITAMAQLADEASGGHVAGFFKTQDEVLKAHVDAETRDSFLLLAKQVDFLSTSIVVVLEILERVVADQEAIAAMDERWESRASPRPELRDVVVGATRIERAYAGSTRPLQLLYVDALRGSFAPEIFEFGFGPELMDALIQARVLPIDVERLEDLKAKGEIKLQLTSTDEKLESYERLASGDFVEMMHAGGPGQPLFIRHRTQAVHPAITVRITPRGRRLLKMIAAGRGRRDG
jgi:hypothetical protein